MRHSLLIIVLALGSSACKDAKITTFDGRTYSPKELVSDYYHGRNLYGQGTCIGTPGLRVGKNTCVPNIHPAIWADKDGKIPEHVLKEWERMQEDKKKGIRSNFLSRHPEVYGKTMAKIAVPQQANDPQPKNKARIEAYRPVFERAAKAYSPAGKEEFLTKLLMSVWQTESHMSVSATPTGSAGEIGPMQFKPETWSKWGKDGNEDGKRQAKNLNDAVHGTANFLSHFYQEDGTWSKALCRYNTGKPHNKCGYLRKIADSSAFLGF